MKQSSQPNSKNHKTAMPGETGSGHNNLAMISDLPEAIAVTDTELALVEGFMQDVINEIMVLGV